MRAMCELAPGVRSGAQQDVAEMSVAEELAKLAARRGAMRELADALEDFSGAADEALTTAAAAGGGSPQQQ